MDFKAYEAAVNTEDFEPPKYLVKPAKGDKGYAIVKREFSKRKPYFIPSLSGTTDEKD